MLLASEGMIDKEIAVEMKVKVASVRTYWERIRIKTKTQNRAHAVATVAPLLLTEEHKEARINAELLGFVVRTIEDAAIFLCDSRGIHTTWNTGVERLLGYKEEEWVGAHGSIFFTPEDRANLEPEQELLEASEAGRSYHERWHVRKDGSRFWGSNNVVPFRPTFAVDGYAKIVRELEPPK